MPYRPTPVRPPAATPSRGTVMVALCLMAYVVAIVACVAVYAFWGQS